MKAVRLFHQKKRFPDGSIIEMKIWKIPEGLKYSLVYIEKGKRVIGYDNAERKGDHRHYEEMVESYKFVSIDKLVEDFLDDVKERRRGL